MVYIQTVKLNFFVPCRSYQQCPGFFFSWHMHESFFWCFPPVPSGSLQPEKHICPPGKIRTKNVESPLPYKCKKRCQCSFVYYRAALPLISSDLFPSQRMWKTHRHLNCLLHILLIFKKHTPRILSLLFHTNPQKGVSAVLFTTEPHCLWFHPIYFQAWECAKLSQNFKRLLHILLIF